MKFKVGDKVIYKINDTQLLGRITQIRAENSLIDYQVCIQDLEKDTQTFVWATSKELRLLEEKEEKTKEDEIVEKTLNKFGVTMNDLKNNDLLCLSLVALLFSQDGAKIFKNILETETCKHNQ